MRILPGFPNLTSVKARSAAYLAPIKHTSCQATHLVGWKQNQTTGQWALQFPSEDYELLIPANDRSGLQDDDWSPPGP